MSEPALPPKILLLNGPNLNMLGTREPALYGSTTLQSIVDALAELAASGTPALAIDAFQSNHEGALIDFIQVNSPGAAGVIINAGAFTHYSYAIRDALAALAALSIPIVEVHITNIHAREQFRHHSIIADVVSGQIVGLGVDGYRLALDWLRARLTPTNEGK